MIPAIRTSGLSKQYRRVRALSDCAVTVPDGRISALIGPNGAGKTTLLRLLAGLARPTAGEMAVLGRIPRQDPAFMCQIGFLAQEVPLPRVHHLPARRPLLGVSGDRDRHLRPARRHPARRDRGQAAPP